MAIEDTVRAIVEAENFNKRVQQFRLVPERHGAGELTTIYAAVAREIYVKSLAPDFAYVHPHDFYDQAYFEACYAIAAHCTEGFTKVGEEHLAAMLVEAPQTLLVLRTLLGLARDEFAHATSIVAETAGTAAISAARVDGLERRGLAPAATRAPSFEQTARLRREALTIAKTIAAIMDRSLFGDVPAGQRLKQDKPDTKEGWDTVQKLASEGVTLSVLLHQRHYGGAFRQILDATSGRRGDQLEDAVAAIFDEAGISYLRTGSVDQGLIKERFNITVTPAPDFVVYDPRDDELRAMLECKGTNNGGTARDKAGRFRALRQECVRLGGVALFAVLGGTGWSRVNDALAPVVGATEGRVFTPATLDELLAVNPFPSLRTR